MFHWNLIDTNSPQVSRTLLWPILPMPVLRFITLPVSLPSLGNRSKWTNCNWYHRHLHVTSLFCYYSSSNWWFFTGFKETASVLMSPGPVDTKYPIIGIVWILPLNFNWSIFLKILMNWVFSDMLLSTIAGSCCVLFLSLSLATFLFLAFVFFKVCWSMNSRSFITLLPLQHPFCFSGNNARVADFPSYLCS